MVACANAFVLYAFHAVAADSSVGMHGSASLLKSFDATASQCLRPWRCLTMRLWVDRVILQSPHRRSPAGIATRWRSSWASASKAATHDL